MSRAPATPGVAQRWSARDRLPSRQTQIVPGALLPRGWRAGVADDGLTAAFDTPQRCLSSAVAHGGLVAAEGLVNRHVGDADRDALHAPEALVADFARRHGLGAATVGMLTGASMRTLRVACAEREGERVTVLVTAGLANARRAGDTADQPTLRRPLQAIGTINLVLATTLTLAPAALAETLTTLTEAKTATLADLGIVSPVSGALATGTGTDATAVFCARDGAPLHYTGKHTAFGEMAARLVIDTLSDAIAHDRDWAEARG